MDQHEFSFSVIRLLFFCLDIPKTNSGQAPEPKNQGCMEMAKILIVLPKRKKLSRFFFFNGNPNGFFNAISMMPKKKLPIPTRK